MGEIERKYGESLYDFCKNSKLFSQKDMDLDYKNFSPNELTQSLKEYYEFIKSNDKTIDAIVSINRLNNLNLFYRGEKTKEIELLNKSALYYNIFFLEDEIYRLCYDIFDRGFKHNFKTIKIFVERFKKKLVYVNFGYLIPIPKFYLVRQEEIMITPIKTNFKIPKETYDFLSKYYSFNESEKAIHTKIIYETTKFEMNSIKDYNDFKLSFPDSGESYNFKSVYDSNNKVQKRNALKFYKDFTIRKFLLDIHYNQLNSLKLNSRHLETNILTIDLLRITQPNRIDLRTQVINLNLPIIENLDMIRVLEFRAKDDRIILLREYLDKEISSINDLENEKERKEKIKDVENYINKGFISDVNMLNKDIFKNISKNTLHFAPFVIADLFGLNNTTSGILDLIGTALFGANDDLKLTKSLLDKRKELKRSPLNVIYNSRISRRLR
jgi:hypothetical protein